MLFIDSYYFCISVNVSIVVNARWLRHDDVMTLQLRLDLVMRKVIGWMRDHDLLLVVVLTKKHIRTLIRL